MDRGVEVSRERGGVEGPGAAGSAGRDDDGRRADVASAAGSRGSGGVNGRERRSELLAGDRGAAGGDVDVEHADVEAAIRQTRWRLLDPVLFPVVTYVGVKWQPTLAPPSSGSCSRCPYLAMCRRDVMRGDFAWCEDLSERDLEAQRGRDQ